MRATTKAIHAASALLLTCAMAAPAAAVDVTLGPSNVGFNSPIGIDWHEPTSKLILSANYPTGLPNNLDLVDPTTGTHTQFSALAGLTNELKIATVRSSACQGGFSVGEVFTGNGLPGQVVRISSDGSTVQADWVTLPGTTDLLRGSFFQDRFCAAGGDLIVVTGNEQSDVATSDGNVYRVTSAGVPTLVAHTGVHLEGVTTVPNLPLVYGPLAGRILAGAEDLIPGTHDYGPNGLIYAINPNVVNNWFTIGAGTGPACDATASVNGCNFATAEIHPEDLDVIRRNADFFGVAFADGAVLTAKAVDFAQRCGQVLVTQEFPGANHAGLFALHWNGTDGFTADELTSNMSVQQWEHVTFTSGQDCATTISITKDPKNATFNIGDQLSFTMVVKNTGALPALDVTLDDPMPTTGGLTWSVTSVTPSHTCTISAAQELQCDLGDLQPGDSVSVVVTTNNAAGAPPAACTGSKLNNIATASSENAQSVQDTGDYTCTPPPPQLKVVKTPDNGTFTSGSQVSFTIVVSNPAGAGAQSATNVQLSDQLPGNGGLTFINVTQSQGSCTIVSNLLSCSLGTIAAGGSVTVTVSTAATTPAAACQSQPNPVAKATADGGLSAQDSGSTSCTPPPPPNLQTVTQGGWGAAAHGNNPGTILNAYFATNPGNVVIGCTSAGGKTLTFTSANAIRGYLPAGGTPNVLNASATNPTSSSSGVFGGQVLALELNVLISNAGKLPAGLGSYVLPTGPAAGKTVSQVLADANKALGGCGLPSYVTTISGLNSIVDSINNMFD